VVKFATERVPPGETCVICEEPFLPEERGVPFKVENSLRWQHFHVRCADHVTRNDYLSRLARTVKRFANRNANPS
jgi:hypothetical protein